MAFRKVFSSSLTDKGIRKIFVQTTDGKNISCRKCHGARIIWVGEKRFRCKKCWSFGSLTAGTFLDGNRLSLRFWYELVWNFVLSHSANKTGKLLGKSPKTCWQGYQFIRWILVQKSADDRKKITGTVEVDESFFGGAFKNLRKKTRWEYRRLGLAKKGRGAALRKQPVFGIFKRNGSVYLELLAEVTGVELEEIIDRKIKKKTTVYSDKFTGYDGLVGLGYIHGSVDHGMEIYVEGSVHVNGMEGFWGLSKTNMHTYKGIKKKNWVYYLKEMEFRYNHRKLSFEEMTLNIIRILMSHRTSSFVPY